MELTYRKCGDYYIPDIALNDTENYQLGRYGRMRQRYLKEHHPGVYSHMLLSETLWKHLSEIDAACNERLDSLIPAMAAREGVTEALRERLSGPRGRSAAGKTAPKSNGNKVNLLIDIQTKLQAGKDAGYEKWAKLFNLKEAAKTLNFLTDNGLTDYDELAARAEEAGQKFDVASARIKQVEARLSELSELRTHIVNYSKTRAVYAAFRKAKNKKDYRLAHESELAMHEAAKKAFDKLGSAKIPTVAQIQTEFSGLLAKKKELYETYKAARKEMIAYQTAKQNIDRLLRIQSPLEPRWETEH